MVFFGRKGGSKKPAKEPNVETSASADPSADPNLIKVYDSFGRELFITREQWRDNVLLGNLESAKGDPSTLYSLIVSALQDGFANDVVSYAEHLHRIDPIATRGATILGIVYMETDRLKEAQRILESCMAKHGEDGVVLTNLAKVYSRQGDMFRAEKTLWRALEIDPNQENGFAWFTSIRHEQGGEKGYREALERVASLPKSWRARIWIARDALQRHDLEQAVSFYTEALKTAVPVPPADMLMQISGDLGNAGALDQIITLISPHFQAEEHGLDVGNNLIKAYFELGKLEDARGLVDKLFSFRRPDWQETLNYWDTELARAGIAQAQPAPNETLAVTLLQIEGPLWSKDSSPLVALLPTKSSRAPRLACFGSAALLPNGPNVPTLQLSDGPGRLSRAVPLLLTERIHLGSDGIGFTMLPWATSGGFVCFAKPYEDAELCQMLGNELSAPEFIVSIVLDATSEPWKLTARAIRREDLRKIGEVSATALANDPAPGTEIFANKLMELLSREGIVKPVSFPGWYNRLSEIEGSDYLLRLEQQLAVFCANLDAPSNNSLNGEREILGGTLHMCLRNPSSSIARILYAQTLRQMRKVRPNIMPEFEEQTRLLQKEHPISGPAAAPIQSILTEVFPSRSF